MSTEKKKKGCPKGGWPGRNKKKIAHEFIQGKIKKILERSMANKNSKFQCELCLMTFKKLFKLKMHLIKSHTGDITEQLSKEEDSKPSIMELMPERKSSRIEQKENKDDISKDSSENDLIPKHLKTESETPLHLVQQSVSEVGIFGLMF